MPVPVVEGLWPTVAIGVLGGVIKEALHLLGIWRGSRDPLTRKELVTAIVLALMGGGAAMLGTDQRLVVQIAFEGAAFPSLFGGVVGATVDPRLERRTDQVERRTGSDQSLRYRLRVRPRRADQAGHPTQAEDAIVDLNALEELMAELDPAQPARHRRLVDFIAGRP